MQTGLLQVHDKEFVTNFSKGVLNEVQMRRIGFGEVTRHPHLIERTKAEVAGTAMSAFQANAVSRKSVLEGAAIAVCNWYKRFSSSIHAMRR